LKNHSTYIEELKQIERVGALEDRYPKNDQVRFCARKEGWCLRGYKSSRK